MVPKSGHRFSEKIVLSQYAAGRAAIVELFRVSEALRQNNERAAQAALSTEPGSDGGGRGGRSGTRFSRGRAQGPSPRVRSAGGGDECRRHALSGHARPSGSATNFVASPDFTRISTVRLPPERASLSAVRTSAGLETALPATSRITSPVLKPRSAAGPSGSTAVTTTPLPPLPATEPAGANVRPRWLSERPDVSLSPPRRAC